MTDLEIFEQKYAKLKKKLEDARGKPSVLLNNNERSLAWSAVTKVHMELTAKLIEERAKFPQAEAGAAEPGVILTGDILPIQH